MLTAYQRGTPTDNHPMSLDDLRREFRDRWDIAAIPQGYRAILRETGAAGRSCCMAVRPPSWPSRSAWRRSRHDRAGTCSPAGHGAAGHAGRGCRRCMPRCLAMT